MPSDDPADAEQRLGAGTGPGAQRRIQPQRLGLAGAGIELGLVVAVMTLGGWWLDQWLGNHDPWCMIVGAGVAIVGGLYKFWLRAKRSFDGPGGKGK